MRFRRLILATYALALVASFWLRWTSSATAEFNAVKQMDGPIWVSDIGVSSSPTPTVVNPSTTVTTTSFDYLPKTIYHSVFWKASATGGNPNLSIRLQCSPDGVNWYFPAASASVTNASADGAPTIAGATIPVCKKVRAILANESAGATTTVTIGFMAQ